ncbi:MAG: nucleotidyltransferase family protein [Prevotella sp.]|nr:nucleotidyltransferase family protein [Prevotella sp.]
MQSMIFAAGLGTRLKPLTDTMPKALVRVGNVTLLEHVIRKLKGAGCRHIVVNVHHFAEQIVDYLNINDFGVDVQVSDETGQLLDTGGGIKRAAPLFDNTLPVLIHNVDILSNIDLAYFYQEACEQAEELGMDALLMVSHRLTQRYLVFDGKMRLVGWTNVATGEVRSPHASVRQMHFTAPTADECSYSQQDCHLCAFSGIHVLAPSAVRAVASVEEDKFPIMDFYLRNCDRLNIRGKLGQGLRLLDVGKLDTLKEAENFIVNYRM